MRLDHDPTHCLLCLVNRRARGNYRGHWGYRPYRRRLRCEMSQFVKRPVTPSGSSGDSDAGVSPAFRAKFPALVEFLTELAFEDGTPREPSTLLTFIEDGVWKLCLNDRALGRTLWVSGDTFTSTVESMERSLEDGTGCWRKAWKPPAKGKKSS